MLIALVGLTLANCAQSTYTVDLEANKEGRLLNEVPQWYVDAQVEKGLIKNRDAEDYIYAVGQGSSPDLQLAVEKAIMIAKANLADQLEGEMNKKSELYITEVGQEGNKQVASKIESTTVNVIEQIKVQGYEEWNKAVYETPTGQYRVYVGLKMGVGEANRLFDYIMSQEIVSTEDIDSLAEEAVDDLMSNAPVEEVAVEELS
tara:strand:- start:7947 stop:8555 length:609 start_codon:yes stop_codon:yes gene_type:complete